ncbi:MAG: tetratricopeptide repeat protein [Acidobacteriota bacterium]
MVQRWLRSDLVRAARQELGLTQSEAAAHFQTSERNYRRWESGAVNHATRGFNVRTAEQRRLLHAIATEFGLDEDELLVEQAPSPSAGPAPTEEGGTTASPLYNVPLPSVRFVGRDADLDELGALVSSPDERMAVAIRGVAGVGKTELALQLAHRLSTLGAFPGGIFWLDAASRDLTNGWASEWIAGRLGMTSARPVDRARAVVTQLGASTQPLLVVLDNVEEWTRTATPFPLPEGARVSLLVTTRHRGLGGSRFLDHELGFLPETESRDLLLRVAGPRLAHHPDLDSLLHRLGGYTLAVELAGVLLRDAPGLSPTECLERLRQPDAVDELGPLTNHESTLSAAFALTWEGLDESARRAWQLAASFEPGLITPALADACGLTLDDRQGLQRLHLIDIQPSGRWRMHRLTRDHGRRAGSTEERKRALGGFLRGCHELASGFAIGVGFDVYQRDRTQFDTATRLDDESLGGEDLVSLCNQVAMARYSLGELESAHELLEHGLELGTSRLGEGHRLVTACRIGLGNTLAALGDYTGSVETLEAAERACQELEDARGFMLDGCRCSLAISLQLLGDYDRAGHLLEQLVAEHAKDDEQSRTLRTTYLADLAIVVLLQGDRERARRLTEEALEGEILLRGPDHLLVAARRANLGWIQLLSGEVDAAYASTSEAMRSYQRIFGDEPAPHVVITKANLALMELERGQGKKARALMEDALAWDLANRGPDHPFTSLTRAKMAKVLNRIGETERALQEQQEAWRIVDLLPPGTYFEDQVTLHVTELSGLPQPTRAR